MNRTRRFGFYLLLLTIIASLSPTLQGAGARDQGERATTLYLPLISSGPYHFYLPLVGRKFPWVSPFGIESTEGAISSTRVRAQAQALGTNWLRLNGVSWRGVQPDEGGAYNWRALATFERDLLAAAEMGMTPVVVVDDNPRWSTIAETSCGALRAERFGDFARFMQALVQRYGGPPYNVHHWELGNEPDVDPRLVPQDAVWGCWGDIDDPFYGGEHYGEMLKVVTPAIREADPAARVLIGGLLLNTYETTDPSQGHPERFLEGILRVGAAPYFDILPYHGHASYYGVPLDYSGPSSGLWQPYGGPALGKPAFLRELMARYGVSKPLSYNEASLGCVEVYAFCQPPGEGFYQAQADHLVRLMVRSASAGVENVIWYTLNSSGWRSSGLLDASQAPRPVFIALSTLLDRSRNADLPPPSVGYAPGVEGYRFARGDAVVDVLWSPEDAPVIVSLPLSEYKMAWTQDGAPLSPAYLGERVQITVGFSAVYIERDVP